jgi:hypothetical protein
MENNERINKDNLSDEIYEALLKVAVNEAIRQDVEAMPSCEELNELYKPSPAFEKRIMKIIDKRFAKRRFSRTLKSFGRIAAIVSIIFTVSAAVLMSVEASRVFIFNIFIGLQEDHAVIGFVDERDVLGVEVGLYTPGYLPYGFGLVFSQSLHDVTISIFQNRDGSQIILYEYGAEAALLGVDIEYTEFSVVYVNQQEARLFSAADGERLNTLIWMSGDTALKLVSDLELGVLLRVAENIFRN